MLSDALRFMPQSDDWLATTAIGGILALVATALLFLSFVVPLLFFLSVPFVLVATALLQGYYVRSMRAAADGTKEAPSFTDWGGLVVDGLKLLVVSFVWSFVVLIPMFVLPVVLEFGSAATESIPQSTTAATQATNLGLGIVGVVGGLLIITLALFVSYVVPAAGANFAIEGNLGAGFHVRTILKGAFTSEYAIAWVLALLILMVIGTVGNLLSIILVGFFISFYAQVASFYLWGRGYADGLGRTSGW
ncbi:DUF4013 domain-containing protein [Haloferax mediterranei ATCC 33500]|uniref:DUF4013 domain-containing protein n=1 Tax=Haloferax mediterranei (strain ATCC 33500 / DSM 1411 / JCM 8866 / NBRC 14739 / NCIMB 2177 / R-4) TaxID=523841 RepID=I3R8I5_HALMT|nr:DUF4013 domain-containing protein [Haloferax mediterranei]AFK20545.1 hypothetical protein HFX_2875 [Haloferax mediterranei ATCC 33500]AHZ23902.1 hypothetical protein BM92_15170 [Haloferax mediterranei ATCC 33500]ELZ98327.1 hypothetical protein C439_16120 [Haloferax mediterranei ATCC 33500]MDX5986700.1 DUF4013 domain-containing protein [Haloferax mediterranei ATCC 33500]QCQ76027.1 DUF4013 domain-containing protein [Haloferax mediterranei ATCC 33500]